MSVEVGPASRRDLREILSLLKTNGLPPDGLDGHLETTLVAREAGRIVGSAAVEPYGAWALLRSIAVDGERRGGGLGRHLALAALDLARERGACEAFLLTETADDFFSRLGFVTIERSVVPTPVRESVEFASACPASARAMSADLRGTKAR